MPAEAGPSSTGTLVTPQDTARPPLPKQVSYCVDDETQRLSDADAENAMEKVVAAIIKQQGYDGIDASALDYITKNVGSGTSMLLTDGGDGCMLNIAFAVVMSGLLVHSQELAMTARRRTPSARDCFTALQHAGPRLQPDSLKKFTKSRKECSLPFGVRRLPAPQLPEWCAPYEEWLPSEEEDTDPQAKGASSGSTRKRRRKQCRPKMDEVPPHLPALPPKHTWLATPSYPIRSEDVVEPLALIDIKVSSTRLTEASLRGLISATDNAVLNSRGRRASEIDTLPAFRTDVFDSPARADGPMASPRASLPSLKQAGKFAVPSTAASASVTSPVTDESARGSARLRKGRALSLRLRTTSSPQSSEIVSSPPQESGADINAPTRPAKKAFLPLHRSSLSVSIGPGPRSATPLESPASSSLRRNTSTSSNGPWTAMPTQSYFTWGPSRSGRTPTGEMPLGTPLTPGAGFSYPPTPADLYSSSNFIGEYEGAGGADDGEGEVTLPGVVNYKRAWYKPNHALKREEE